MPFHVIAGDVCLNDGDFLPSDIFDYYEKNREVPTTSAINPAEYRGAYLKIREDNPECEILHLCYSAVTTATWQNALVGSEDLDYITHVDTKCVSAGLGNFVMHIADYYEQHPDITVAELAEVAEKLVSRSRMMFIPDDLSYLLAGGRLSKTVYTAANLLNIKPVIQIEDGRVMSAKKYRGSIPKITIRFLKDVIQQYKFESVFLLYSEGLSEQTKDEAEEFMKENGYNEVYWVKAGGVISVHSGPGAIGVGGIIKGEAYG